MIQFHEGIRAMYSHSVFSICSTQSPSLIPYKAQYNTAIASLPLRNLFVINAQQNSHSKPKIPGYRSLSCLSDMIIMHVIIAKHRRETLNTLMASLRRDCCLLEDKKPACCNVALKNVRFELVGSVLLEWRSICTRDGGV